MTINTSVEDAKAALAAFDADRDSPKQLLAAGIWNAWERAVVREALVEYIERHKPYVPPPEPPTVQEQFAKLREKYPTATLTEHQEHKECYLVTIHDWKLPLGYDRDSCTVYFVIPQGYKWGVPPDRFYTDNLLMANKSSPYMTRELKTEPFEMHGHQWSGEGMHPFPAPAGTRIWFWKVTDWNRANTLLTYAWVIKHRLENVTAGQHFRDADD